MTERANYLRAEKAIDQRKTATAIVRVADWLDIADSRTRTTVYPQLQNDLDHEETEEAWMWAALLIADVCDFSSSALRMLATSVNNMYREAE